MKENSKSRMWFKDHFLVFSDPTKLGMKRIEVTYKMKADFDGKVYHPYLYRVSSTKLVEGCSIYTDLSSSMSVIDPC